MKNGIKKIICIILITITYNSYVYALDDNEKNINSNIKSLNLIGNYTKTLKSNIIQFREKYKINKNYDIDNYIRKIDNINNTLDKIYRGNFSNKEILQYKTLMLNELRILNKNIVITLKEQRGIYNKDLQILKNNYFKIGIKASKIIEGIIIKMAKEIQNRKIKGSKYTKIIRHLKILNIESKKLTQIKDKDINTKEELKAIYIPIYENIKSEIIIIKKILKK